MPDWVLREERFLIFFSTNSANFFNSIMTKSSIEIIAASIIEGKFN